MTPQTLTPTGSESLVERLRRATIGRYDVYAELGSGGMAAVFLALDLSLERQVAIKVMLPALASSDEAVERFKREARVAAALTHPNIIGIFAVGDDPELAYYVMKFVEGRSLDSVLKDEGRQDIPFVQAIIGYAGNALHFAHQRGVVHRDVKPANFMLDKDGWLVVTDFGIAKIDEVKGLTLSGTLVGTPYYMSPEQFNGSAITGAADQYALGVVAFELLTGHPPFNGTTLAEVMRGHLLDDPPSLRAIRPEVPPEMEACVNRMLAKKASDRFPTLADAVEAFGSILPRQEAAVRTHIITLAKSGALLQPRMSIPASPMPQRNPARPSKAAPRGSAPPPARSGRGSNRGAAPVEEEEAAPTVRRRALGPVLGAVAGMLALTVGAYVVRPDLFDRAAASPTSSPAASPATQPPQNAGDPLVPPTGAVADSATARDSVPTTAATPATTTPARDTAVIVASPPVAPPPRPRATPPRTRQQPAAAVPGTGEPATTSPPTDVAKDATPKPAPETSSATASANTPANTPTNSPTNTPATTPATTPPPPTEPVPSGPGSILVRSTVDGAVLYVNGQPLRPIGGAGMLTIPIPAGEVRLSIRSEGCAAFDTTVTVRPGQLTRVGSRNPRC